MVVQAHRRFRPISRPKKDTGTKSNYFAPLANPYAIDLLFIAMTGALAGLAHRRPILHFGHQRQHGLARQRQFLRQFLHPAQFRLAALAALRHAEDSRQDRHPRRLDGPAVCAGRRRQLSPARRPPPSAFRCCASPKAACARPYTVRSGNRRLSPVDSRERSFVKIAVDGVGARIAEGIAAAGLFSVGSTGRARRQRLRPARHPLAGLADVGDGDCLARRHPTTARSSKPKRASCRQGRTRSRMRALSRSMPVYDGIGQGRRVNICHVLPARQLLPPRQQRA